MGERFLLAVLARARESKGGILLVFVGVVVMLAFLVFGLVSVAGNAILIWTGAGPVMRFLATGPGVLTGFAVSVFITLLGVALLFRAGPQANASATVIQQTGGSQTEKDRELERVRAWARKTEKENKRLSAFLADPKAVERREEEMLRRRCLELAETLQKFAQAHRRTELNRSTDPNETVARFVQRHKWKVDELRDELDTRGWLTPQERDTLTFHADDYSHKIGEMADALRRIGMGH